MIQTRRWILVRIVKDDEEIGHIRAASKVAAAGMKAAVKAIRPGLDMIGR